MTTEHPFDYDPYGTYADKGVLPLDPFPLGEDWYGACRSFDGTSLDGWEELAPDDVAEIIAATEHRDAHWSWKIIAVARLKDGRYISYETFYDVSGDGFRRETYGGEADIIFSSTLEAAVMFGLTDRGRELCGLPEDWNG